MCPSMWVCLFSMVLLCVLPVLTHSRTDPVNENWDFENWDSSDLSLSISNGEIRSDITHHNGLPYSAYFVPSPTERERRKRAVGSVAVKLVQLGRAAVNRLLTGTWKIRSDDKRIRKYVKIGDYEAALRDFRSVNPTFPSTYRRSDGAKIIEGRAGDKLIQVNSRGEQGMPTISIIDYNQAGIVHEYRRKKPLKAIVTGQPIDRIIYTQGL